MRALLSVLLLTSMLVAQPISLHPENPHYLLYKGEPTVLVTSAEHYGAVLNLDFDYQTYLRTLAAYDLNYTRIFTGNFCYPAELHSIILTILLLPDMRMDHLQTIILREEGVYGYGNSSDF